MNVCRRTAPAIASLTWDAHWFQCTFPCKPPNIGLLCCLQELLQAEILDETDQ